MIRLKNHIQNKQGGKPEKCEYCYTILLKQEDYESSLLPRLLHPSLSLLIYFAEDRDIKKT